MLGRISLCLYLFIPSCKMQKKQKSLLVRILFLWHSLNSVPNPAKIHLKNQKNCSFQEHLHGWCNVWNSAYDVRNTDFSILIFSHFHSFFWSSADTPSVNLRQCFQYIFLGREKCNNCILVHYLLLQWPIKLQTTVCCLSTTTCPLLVFLIL
jgi:hypothetical protein